MMKKQKVQKNCETETPTQWTKYNTNNNNLPLFPIGLEMTATIDNANNNVLKHRNKTRNLER